MINTRDLQKPKSGRPRSFDRQKALNEAMDLFWRHGFEGTTTAMLTEAMNISPPSLYAAFGSKDLLYEEVLATYVNKYGLFLSDGLKRTANIPARKAMEIVLLKAAKQFCDSKSHSRGCMVSTGSLQMSPENQKAVNMLAQYRSAAREIIQNYLDEAKLRNELHSEADTKVMATYFSAVIQGMAIQAHDGVSLAVLKDIVQIAMQSWK